MGKRYDELVAAASRVDERDVDGKFQIAAFFDIECPDGRETTSHAFRAWKAKADMTEAELDHFRETTAEQIFDNQHLAANPPKSEPPLTAEEAEALKAR